jgi:hypothetical protein
LGYVKDLTSQDNQNKSLSLNNSLLNIGGPNDLKISSGPSHTNCRERADESFNAEIGTFLSESSVRDRLRSLPSVQNNINSINSSINLFSSINPNVDKSTGFKQTITEIILAPYIENNRTLSKNSYE